MKKPLQTFWPGYLSKIAITVLLLAYTSKAIAEIKYEYTPSYSAGQIQVYEPKPTSAEIASGKVGFGKAGGNCGDIANMMGVLGLNLNEKSLQNLVSNWKGMMLPVTLYLLSSYVPQAKEALMGARTLSQFVANLGGQSCEAVMKQVERMSMADSKIVDECMKNKLGSGKTHSQSEIDSAMDSCIHNPGSMSLISALGGDPEKVGKFISFLDPQSYARCAAANAGIKPLENASYEDLKKASFEDRIANIGILLMPTVDVSLQDGNMKFSTMKIDGKDVSLLKYVDMVKSDLSDDIDKLLEDIEITRDEKAIIEILNKFGSKYNLDVSGISGLLELVALWGNSIDKKTEKVLTEKEAICKGEYYTIKNRYLKDELFRQALLAIKLALLNKMSAIEHAAAASAAIGGGYGCKDAEGKKVSKETVDAMKEAKNNAIQQIDSKLSMLSSKDKACAEISAAIKKCLGRGADINGVIEIYDEATKKVTKWLVYDDCSTIKLTENKTGQPDKIDNPFTPSSPIGSPKTFKAFFEKGDFALVGIILLGLSIIYFGITIVRAVSQEQWGIVGINGTVILVIIGVIFKLLQ